MATLEVPAELAVPYPTALAHFPLLRQSLLANFADCQLTAGFRLRMAIPRPGSQILHTDGFTTWRQSAGRLVHATIAEALRTMFVHTAEAIPPGDVIAIWDEMLRQAGPVGESFALPAHEDAFARRVLRTWAERTRITVSEIYGIEQRLSAPVRYPDGHGGHVERLLSGQLDLLLLDPSRAHATVPDWKHSWRLPPKQGVEEDDEAFGDDERDDGDDRLSVEGYFQQQFYALLIFLQPELSVVQSVTLRESYLPRMREREATLWRHQLPDLIAYFAATAERFDRSYEASIRTRRGRLRRRPLATPAQWGEPSPGGHCSFCPGAQDCPVPKDARESGLITTAAEAQTSAGVVLRLKRVVAMHEKSLRVWADREGPVRVRDGKRERYFGFLERERVERPTLRQVSDAMLAGRDPRELYKRKVSTVFANFAAEDQLPEIDPDDVVALFEHAAERAKTRTRGRGRSAA